MLAEHKTAGQRGGQRFYVLDLGFCDGREDVARPDLDEGAEGAVAEGAVGAAVGEVIGEGGDADAEVGSHAVFLIPEVFDIFLPVRERIPRQPGRIKTRSANNHVDPMFISFTVDEALLGDALHIRREDRHVVGDEGFEVAWCGRGAAAPWVEVFGDDGVGEGGFGSEFGAHFLVCVGTGGGSLGGAFNDEFEALIEFVFDLFAVFEVFLGVVFEEVELFFAVCGKC